MIDLNQDKLLLSTVDRLTKQAAQYARLVRVLRDNGPEESWDPKELAAHIVLKDEARAELLYLLRMTLGKFKDIFGLEDA